MALISGRSNLQKRDQNEDFLKRFGEDKSLYNPEKKKTVETSSEHRADNVQHKYTDTRRGNGKFTSLDYMQV
jgi:hypothetical protein